VTQFHVWYAVTVDASGAGRRAVRYRPECRCGADHTGQVCSSAGFDVPPSYQAVTADHVQDITGSRDEEQFYLSTQDMYRLHRYVCQHHTLCGCRPSDDWPLRYNNNNNYYYYYYNHLTASFPGQPG